MTSPKQGAATPGPSFRVVNLDHEGRLPGGVGQPWDSAVVLSTTETVPHPITGKPQPKRLFPEHGVTTLESANAWAKAALAAAGVQ